MSDTLEWETNTPKDPSRALLRVNQTIDEYKAWRSQFEEGPPKASETYTTKVLEANGYIGLYRIAATQEAQS